MFVLNRIPSFRELTRKNIYQFITRINNSANSILQTVEKYIRDLPVQLIIFVSVSSLIYVLNRIPSFRELTRKNIYQFITRINNSANSILQTVEKYIRDLPVQLIIFVSVGSLIYVLNRIPSFRELTRKNIYQFIT